MQYAAAVGGDDEAEIETEIAIMENHQAAVTKLAAEIDALKPAMIAAHAECRDAFNRQWRESEQTRHCETKAKVQAVLDKINLVISPLLDELKLAVESPSQRPQGDLLDPAGTAIGTLPKLEVEEDVCEPVPTMASPPHPLAFVSH